MSTKQTDSSREKKSNLNDWMPNSGRVRKRATEPVNEDLEAEYQKMVEEGVIDGIVPKRNASDENENSIGTGDAIRQEEIADTLDSLQTESSNSKESPVPMVIPKRTSSKQRKESLEEYRQTFLAVPKLQDRKPVFISREVRDRIDEIVHRLGGRGRSVSGFIENLARHHLNIYAEDIEIWRKL